MISTEQEARILELHADGLTYEAIRARMNLCRETIGKIIRLRRVRTVEERKYGFPRSPPQKRVDPYLPEQDDISWATAEIRVIGWLDQGGVWHQPWTSEQYQCRGRSFLRIPWSVPIVKVGIELAPDESVILGEEGD